MTRTTSEMLSYYAARAPYYDEVYLKPERRNDIAFLKQYLPLRLAARSTIEVACGTGYWTQFIAPAVRRLIATDATPVYTKVSVCFEKKEGEDEETQANTHHNKFEDHRNYNPGGRIDIPVSQI